VKLAGLDDESVEFVEELGIAWELGFNERANLFVGAARISLHFGREEIVAFEDAARVSVDNEDEVPASVKEDGVGGFRADAADGEELIAQSCGGGGEETVERTAVIFIKKSDERFEGFGLLAEIARGAEVLGERGGRDAVDGGRGEKLCCAKVGDGAFDVFPGGVLREDGADDDFEAGTAGPPVLRTMSSEECVVVAVKREEARWLGVGNTTERGRQGGDHLRRRGGLGHLKGTIARAAGQVKKWGTAPRWSDRSREARGRQKREQGPRTQKSFSDCECEREF